jgi:hypothetical protein
MRPLNIKARLVLAELQAAERPMRAKDIAAAVSQATVCPDCGGTGDPTGADLGRGPAWGIAKSRACSRCYGRGHLWFDYGSCMAELKKLHKAGLVERVSVYDEFGDLTSGIAWSAKEASADDPLEQAWNLPAVQR